MTCEIHNSFLWFEELYGDHQNHDRARHITPIQAYISDYLFFYATKLYEILRVQRSPLNLAIGALCVTWFKLPSIEINFTIEISCTRIDRIPLRSESLSRIQLYPDTLLAMGKYSNGTRIPCQLWGKYSNGTRIPCQLGTAVPCTTMQRIFFGRAAAAAAAATIPHRSSSTAVGYSCTVSRYRAVGPSQQRFSVLVKIQLQTACAHA